MDGKHTCVQPCFDMGILSVFRNPFLHVLGGNKWVIGWFILAANHEIRQFSEKIHQSCEYYQAKSWLPLIWKQLANLLACLLSRIIFFLYILTVWEIVKSPRSTLCLLYQNTRILADFTSSLPMPRVSDIFSNRNMKQQLLHLVKPTLIRYCLFTSQSQHSFFRSEVWQVAKQRPTLHLHGVRHSGSLGLWYSQFWTRILLMTWYFLLVKIFTTFHRVCTFVCDD